MNFDFCNEPNDDDEEEKDEEFSLGMKITDVTSRNRELFLV